MSTSKFVYGYFTGVASWNIIVGPFMMQQQWWSDSTRMWLAVMSLFGLGLGTIVYLACLEKEDK